jgi:hypothetical protein
MKNLITLLLSGSVIAITASCSSYNSNLGYGGQPTGVVVSTYTTPGSIANTNVKPVKSGEACTNGVLWIAAWGDAGTDTAMKAGNINKIATVEYSNYSILSGLYSKYCTITYGE